MLGNSDYATKKVLVTGGSGFIGSMLCDHLCQQGAEVHAISRQARSTSGANIRWWQGDLADHDAVQRLFAAIKPDITFHLASEVTGSRELAMVLPTLNANLLSAVNILIAATEHDCRRVVMAGSLEEPETDTHQVVPCSPYAAAKWASSGYARMFHALYQTPVVMARLYMVYGPGQQDLRKLVPYVTLSLLRGEVPRLSSGQRPVDWIYVADIVNGLLAMGLAAGIDGGTLELGSGELVTTHKVVEMLSEIIDAGIEPDFGAFPDRPMEQVRTADVKDTRQSIGWQPAVSLQQGLEETVAWYRQLLESGKLS